MAIRYRDRVSKLLDTLKQFTSPEAKMLIQFVKDADSKHEADQLSLSRSFDNIRALAMWAKSSIDQE